MTTTETAAQPLPLPPYHDTSKDKGARGVIHFGSQYALFNQYPRMVDGELVRFRGQVMIPYLEGETVIECAQRVARRVRELHCIGDDARGTLARRQGGCELPHDGYTRFGWTRETRASGSVSVIPDIFLVF